VHSSLKYILFSVCLTLILPGAVFATEKDNQAGGESQQPQEQEQEVQEYKEDSTANYDDEYMVNDPFMLEDQIILSQEAITTEKPVAVKTNLKSGKDEVQEQDESNSAMSFNFIYYIIDKFKLADPLD
jgi:hypothetical protein